jgi:hypothetical protein
MSTRFAALAKSYPDYSQMNPEEMGREEWGIFYPLTNWNDIKILGEKIAISTRIKSPV